MTSLDATVPERQYGVSSMSAPLRRVMVRRPATAGDFAGADWRVPDPAALGRQHEQFTGLLISLGCEVVVAPAADGLVDATYIRDPGLMTARGAIVFEMAKPARQAEPELLDAALRAAGVPVLARLAGPARADGGDFIWLDRRTLLAGHSFRTNVAARSQLADALAPDDVVVAQVSLPSVPDEEYATMACNVLAVRPRVVVMLDGSEISLKGDGGPTCLTAPLWRE